MTTVGKTLVALIIAGILGAGYFFFIRGNEGRDLDSIKVGVIAPLSGDAAVYGEPKRNVVALAVAEINLAGGVEGRPLEVIYEDGQCTGTAAANAMQKLATVDGVDYVIGGFCSGESLAAVPIAEANGVFLLSGGSSSPDLTDVSEFFARTYPSDASQGIVLADIAYNDKEWETIAFIQEQTDYAQGIRTAFTSEFEALGGSVLHEEFPTAETDFRTALSKLRSEEPDALFVSVQTPAVGERILQQMQDLAWEVPLLMSDTLTTDTEILARHAEALEGALGAEFAVDAENETFSVLLAAYEGAYGEVMPFQTYGQTVYDGVYMLKAAIEEVGDDPTAVAEWFRTVTGWEGASGRVTIGRDGDRVGGHAPRVIEDGALKEYLSPRMMMEDTGGTHSNGDAMEEGDAMEKEDGEAMEVDEQ